MTAIPNSAVADPNPPPEAVKEKIREEFPHAPVMVKIAECESELKQYKENGSPLRNKKSSASGLFQIVSSIHRADALEKGHDIYTLDGNIGYAKELFKRYGTKPWKESRHCWSNVS